jgi:hypothetical protein
LRESIGLYLKEANFIYNFILIRFNSFGKNINIIAMSERIFLVKKKFFCFVVNSQTSSENPKQRENEKR